MERSCMCCQESGEREAAVSLFCPKAKAGERKFRKVCICHKFEFLHCSKLSSKPVCTIQANITNNVVLARKKNNNNRKL